MNLLVCVVLALCTAMAQAHVHVSKELPAAAVSDGGLATLTEDFPLASMFEQTFPFGFTRGLTPTNDTFGFHFLEETGCDPYTHVNITGKVVAVQGILCVNNIVIQTRHHFPKHL